MSGKYTKVTLEIILDKEFTTKEQLFRYLNVKFEEGFGYELENRFTTILEMEPIGLWDEDIWGEDE